MADLKKLQNNPNHQLSSIDNKLNQLLKNLNFEDTKLKKIDLLNEIIINKLLNRELLSDYNPKNLLFNEIRSTQSLSSLDSN